MINKPLVVSVLWMVCFLTGCSENKTPLKETSPQKSLITDTSITEIYQVKFVTSKGEFVVEVYPEWAPIGATQFHKLVKARFYDDCYFFRVIDNLIAQAGVNGDPQVHQKWNSQNLQDEKFNRDNNRGTVAFAQSPLPNSRSTQFYINYQNNNLVAFAPFGKVISGMKVVDSFYSGYNSKEIDQLEISLRGNSYIEQNFPRLDRIITARIVEMKKEVEEKK